MLSQIEESTNSLIELYNLFQNRQMGEPLVKVENKKFNENIQVSLNNINEITNFINQKDEFCKKEELITVSMNNFKNAALDEIMKRRKDYDQYSKHESNSKKDKSSSEWNKNTIGRRTSVKKGSTNHVNMQKDISKDKK